MELTSQMEDCRHPKVGVGVLVVRNNSFLLGKRCGKHMFGYYASPGGHLEPGESFAECARREVLEETGLQVSEVRFLTVGNYALNQTQYIDIDLVAFCAEGDPVAQEPHKCAEWRWYGKDELPEPLFIVTAKMIECYLSGGIVSKQAITSILTQK